ncbi:MAG TPA: hypothetical protein VFV87_20505 [Pirellulaceae bacterium]|nr:hypothetical protein [Pirellulaceae bacterium]
MAKKKRPARPTAKKAPKKGKKPARGKTKPKAKAQAARKPAKKKAAAAKSVAKKRPVKKKAAKPAKKSGASNPSKRTELGAKNVGEPIWELKAATAAVLREPEFQSVRGDAIDYYFEKFLMSFLPQAIDEALNDAQLANLSPAAVRAACFLLVGDMIRKLNRRLNPSAAADQTGWWQEKLLVRLAAAAGVPAESYVQSVLEIKDPEDDAPALVERVAQSVGLSPNSLFMFHTMMIEVVEEDVLDEH